MKLPGPDHPITITANPHRVSVHLHGTLAETTRALTLLGWMRGVDDKPPLTWDQVRDVALQIEHQLAQPLPTTPTVATRAVSKPSSPLTVFVKSHTLTDEERAVLALPPRLGGMGLTNPEQLADVENLNSVV